METQLTKTSDGWTIYRPTNYGVVPPQAPTGPSIQYRVHAGPEWAAWSEPTDAHRLGWSPSYEYRWLASPSTATWDQSEGSLPTDTQARTAFPMATGFLDYFPNAVAEVAKLGAAATRQHHPDEEMHWDRNKSTEHADKILRHLVDRGKLDADGERHSAKVAWRALALLQEELESDLGLPISRASRA